MMRHRWWHDHIADRYFAVATDERGEIVSAWMHAGGDVPAPARETRKLLRAKAGARHRASG